MAGLINPDDVTAVKERSSLLDVVREHVTLRPAGPGAMKGLCPFHEEKTPSFTVRETVGTYHCFGCGQSGDVLDFLQQVEHLSFVEALEVLAAKAGMEVRSQEPGATPTGERLGRRSRLVEAHRVAQTYYTDCLLQQEAARIGRDFLRHRDFDRNAVTRFGVGFAPRDGDALTRVLLSKGFDESELVAAGLSGRGSRGLYDRFRGRLMWPIHSIAGETIGFGARRLFDDDKIAAKYLNTTETAIYKKSQVLYGLDLSKGDIASQRQAVIVEGYTDVMAAHLSGIPTAVATCGTAFGVEHIKILRRILRDEPGLSPARVVFTFDGDAAGQQAAMKAFEEDQRWASQSHVAVAADGMDPCELRQQSGPQAVQLLVADAVPMFEFAARTTLRNFDLRQVDGRVAALQALAPILAGIRDPTQASEYQRAVAGWVGVEVDEVRAQVGRVRPALRGGRGTAAAPPTGSAPPTTNLARASLDSRDPVVQAEHQLLQVALQHPALIPVGTLERLGSQAFAWPGHQAVAAALIQTGAPNGTSLASWIAQVREHTAQIVQPLLAELSVAPLPTMVDPAIGTPSQAYCDSLIARVYEVSLRRRIAEATSAMRRLDAAAPQDPSVRARAREISIELMAWQRELAGLREGTS